MAVISPASPHPGGALTRVARATTANGSRPVQRGLLDSAGDLAARGARWAFSRALDAAGIPAEQLMGFLNRAGGAISSVINNPGGFLRNLIRAVVGGFQQFASNIGSHLQRGLLGWLTGALASSGLRLPEHFDLPGIFSLVMQVLGLTFDRLREMAVQRIGERNVALIEHVVGAVRTFITGGAGALWELVREQIAGLRDQVMEGIREFVVTQVVQTAIARIASMFTPVGAIIQAVQVIYNVVLFIMERARQLVSLGQAVVNSVAEIAAGNVTAAANAVEQALGRAVPVVISFMAGLLGLGGIGQRIRAIIDRVRGTVDRAISWAFDRLMAVGRRVAGAVRNAVRGGGRREPGAVHAAVAPNAATAAQHPALAEAAVREMQTMPADAPDYPSLRRAAEARARQIESSYSSRLQPGVGLRVVFNEAERDADDGDLDFQVVIAPNDTRRSGAIATAASQADLTRMRDQVANRLWAESELKTLLACSDTLAQRRIQEWKSAGRLFELAPRGGRDPFTTIALYTFSRAKANPAAYSGRRGEYGYVNPDRLSLAGRQILAKTDDGGGITNPSAAAASDAWPYSADFHENRARYKSWRTGTRFGFDRAILGHKLGASNHWNRWGHTMSRDQNVAYNMNPDHYGGPEYKPESDATGCTTNCYRVPAKIFGSHDDWL